MKNKDFKHILNKNYFELFGIQETFVIDVENLKHVYLNLQKQFHPDYFALDNQSTDAFDKNIIIAVSAHINNAYKTLINPLLRAILLLKLSNIEYDLTQDTSIAESFLVEQMEIHEEIEEAKPTKNIIALENIEAKLKTQKNIIINNIATEFGNLYNKTTSLNYEKIKQLIKQLAFYDKLEYLVNNSINDILTGDF